MSPVDFGFDRSIMLMLTPGEIKNMLTDFAERYHQARLDGALEDVEDLTQAYYNMSFNMLQEADPTRFISNS